MTLLRDVQFPLGISKHCFLAGHTHVSPAVTVDEGAKAVELMLEVVTRKLNLDVFLRR